MDNTLQGMVVIGHTKIITPFREEAINIFPEGFVSKLSPQGLNGISSFFVHPCGLENEKFAQFLQNKRAQIEREGLFRNFNWGAIFYDDIGLVFCPDIEWE